MNHSRPEKKYPKNSAWGALGVLGGSAHTNFLLNYTYKFFSSPCECRCTHCTPWLRLWPKRVLSGGRILMKIDTVYYVSGHCWNGFQGHRSKVKVMTRLSSIMAEACILTMWCRGSLCFSVLLRSLFILWCHMSY